MKKVLVIYENVPESTDVFILDVPAEDLKWMAKCHRQFVNNELTAAQEKACDRMSKYLLKHKPVDDKGPINITGFDLCIITGFIV